MGDYSTYLSRKRARKEVQLQAARRIAEKNPEHLPKVEEQSRNVYVYFENLPHHRIKVGPVRSWHERRRQGNDWYPIKTYSTTNLSNLEVSGAGERKS